MKTSPSEEGKERLSLLGRSALRYAEQGWTVFPLWPRDKTPLLRGNWQTHATTDENIITEWWTQNPTANIGLPTGSKFDVLDLDGPEGISSLNEVAPQYRHDGPLVITGRGYHCFFLPSGHGNRGNLRPKMDFRGMGGYVVGPPSIHPDGRTYRWDIEHHRGIAATCWAAPEWLTTLLDGSVPSRTLPTIVQSGTAAATTPAKGLALGEVAVRDILPDQLPVGLRLRATRPDIRTVADALGLPLKERQNYYLARCIFGTHTDSTPSLVLYPHDNSFHCFGCGAHGDSYDLEKRTYIGAI